MVRAFTTRTRTLPGSAFSNAAAAASISAVPSLTGVTSAVPSGLSSKDRAVGLSELQRWREFDARADLDLTEAAATEMIGCARELVRAAEIDMIGLLRRSAGEA